MADPAANKNQTTPPLSLLASCRALRDEVARIIHTSRERRRQFKTRRQVNEAEPAAAPSRDHPKTS